MYRLFLNLIYMIRFNHLDYLNEVLLDKAICEFGKKTTREDKYCAKQKF